MKLKLLSILIVLALILGPIVDLARAEDGDLFRRNISKTPDLVTEKAAIYMMDFYVPAQASTGIVGPVDNYLLADETTAGYEARNYAKPLLAAYIDGPEGLHLDSLLAKAADFFGFDNGTDQVVGVDEATGGIIFGAMDAFIGVSLDDGTSWRTENLSRSAALSSFTLGTGEIFPGHVHQVVHQVAEDKILAVWVSKYCKSGFPLYALDPADTATATYLGDLETTWSKNALFLYDFFGVSGKQGSVNYTEQGYPEIGEIPYSCVWTARGKLLPGDDPMTADAIEASHVVWTNPERLTSGVRDANLPAVDCAKNAGCAITWQEDPEGLRPGKGLGPGEGWSGAIANAKTDIWYSYITFADFDYVKDDLGAAVLIEDYEALKGTSMDRPKPYVPMAMPVRITDNDMCRAVAGLKNPEDPFCWVDFDSISDLDHANITSFFANLTGPMEGADFCSSVVQWTNPGGTTLDICVTEDGRWMIGRVGATRVRMVLKAYTPAGAPDHDGDGIADASAWLSFGAEETKALGVTQDVDGTTYDPVDIGKDMYYYSFDYAKPYNLHVNTALTDIDPKAFIVQQGGMINQPAQCSDWFPTYEAQNPAITCSGGHGTFFDPLLDPLTGYEYYLTEISRRFAMTLNNPANITNTEINQSGLAGMLIYKQGVIWQGGPADILLRRVVIPDTFDPAVDNPYAYENMDCDEWLYTDGTNPNYLKGLCMSPAINISGTTIKTCTSGSGNDACAATFPVSEDGSIYVELDKFPKVFEWRSCDGATAIDGCEDDNDIDDQSWENPFDVAKGHRGFLYGDMVMMMYAWSPNWNSNAVGNDHYNLYQRRSFDGGITWTTTPASWCGPTDGLCGDGLQALEYYYGATVGEFVPYVWEYEAGAFEQARNLSLLHGNKITILDPRYSPPGGLKQYPTIRTDWLEANADLLNFTSEDVLPYEDDAAIDPSKFYMVYETGDNTTVAVGEAIPLNLYYSRATVFGDIYEWFDYVNDENDDLLVEPRWPWLENAADDLSGEASVVMNPGGTFVYNVWNQWREDILPDGHEHIYDSDIIFRRLMWLPDDSTLQETLAPIATILYTSHTEVVDFTQTLVLIGTARSLSGTEIVEYEWSVSQTGGAWKVVGNDKIVKIPVGNLHPGWQQFQFKAKDKGGRWSPGATFSIMVYEKLPTNQIFLPIMVLKP
jgi:hypothetical protein